MGVGGADGALSPNDAEEQVEKLKEDEELDEQRVTEGGYSIVPLSGRGVGLHTWISSSSSPSDKVTRSSGGGRGASVSSRTNGDDGGTLRERRRGDGSGSEGGATRHESEKKDASDSTPPLARGGAIPVGSGRVGIAGVMGEEGRMT